MYNIYKITNESYFMSVFDYLKVKVKGREEVVAPKVVEDIHYYFVVN